MKMIATRDGFGDEITELGKANGDIYVVDADIGKSCKTGKFSAELPLQHVNVGIAEQSAAGLAAGLATCGKIPFVVTYAAFGSMRMCEQIRQEICYPHLNVKIACSHGGVTPANDGASHQCIEDMGILSTLPGMTVVMPADYNSARKLVKAAADFDGPVYLRFTRDAVPVIYPEDQDFTIGQAIELRHGDDASIIAIGDVLHLALEASDELKKQGLNVRVLDMHTLKPLDVRAVEKCLEETGSVVTVEDHNVINGLGYAVSAVAADMGQGMVKRIGIQDQYGMSAPYERLLAINGITKENIIDKILQMKGKA